MLLRSPAEYYFKYLVAHPDRYDNLAIRQMTAERGIDWVSEEYVDKLRQRFTLPEPFYPTDPSHGPSYRFVCEQQLLRMFVPDPEMSMAVALLDVPRAREFVETMLLSHAPREAIAKTVLRYGHPCTSTAVQRFAHFFWNVELLDSTQMKIHLNLRFERLGTSHKIANPDEPFDHAVANAGRKASYQDPRKLAAELPFSPFAALLVQMRMGVMPERIDVASRMLAVRDMATIRALETLHFATPGDAARALNYVTAAKIMQELLETVQKPDEQLREQLSAIALRTDDRPVPSIHQLSRGQHTVNLEPTPEGTYEPESLGDADKRE